MSKSRALILAICVSFLIFSHLHLSFVNLNNQGMRVIMWWSGIFVNSTFSNFSETTKVISLRGDATETGKRRNR